MYIKKYFSDSPLCKEHIHHAKPKTCIVDTLVTIKEFDYPVKDTL